MGRRYVPSACVEILVVIGIIAILIATMVRQIGVSAKTEHCQSNMRTIGRALKMYLADWDHTYPVNGSLAKPSSSVRIEDPAKPGRTGGVRFTYGINWVEALQPYVRKIDKGNAWICPAVPGSNREHGYVAYALNANLAGRPAGVIRNGRRLMASRELSWLDHAVLRPKAPSLSSRTPPDDPFLDTDETTPHPKYKLHRKGSNILFVDGRVGLCSMRYFPKTCQWDPVDKQWYNYARLPESDRRNKSIAVSP